MFRSITLAVALSVMSLSAANAGHHMQFHWMPHADKSHLTIAPEFSSKEIKTETNLLGSSTESTNTLSGFGARLEYVRGFSDSLAVGFGSTYKNLKSETTTGSSTTASEITVVGWEDLNIFIDGWTDMGPGLYYGLNGVIPFGKDASNGVSSGRYQAEPYVGVKTEGVGLDIGARLAFNYKFQGTEESGGSIIENEDGHDVTLSLAAECGKENKWGVELGFVHTMDQKSTQEVLQTSTAAARTDEFTTQSHETGSVNVYGVFGFDSNFELIPSFRYSMTLSRANIDDTYANARYRIGSEFTEATGEVAVRYGF